MVRRTRPRSPAEYARRSHIPLNFPMPLFRLMVLLMSVLIASTACSSPAPESHGQFVARDVRVGEHSYRYQVFVPARHGKGSGPLPAILFLHGSGERGSDNQAQVKVGLPAHVRQHRDDFSALVVIPQAPENAEWTQEGGPIALAALDAAMKEFNGDPARVYLTGLSMGGYGSYELALQQPRRFAAVVPVCGGLTVDWTDERPQMQAHSVANAADPFAEAANRLKGTPVWIFHGAKDDLVPPDQSRKMYAALKAAGGDVRYTEFPDANHNAWDPAYSMPELWRWLFEKHR